MLRALAFLFVSLIPIQCGSWGFYAHKSINRMAVYTLPSELMAFYKAHIEFVTEHAVDADKRRYALDKEAPRHYIDVDHYGTHPFREVPRRWDSAVSKYTEDTLLAYGIVPWHVERMYFWLVESFRQKDIPAILKTSADLGHYIADAHVPLHTTENYNGQLTGQHGIHGFWESRLPELYADEYDYLTGKATFLLSPRDVIWDAVEHSHRAVDSVLRLERELSERFPKDRKYAVEERSNRTVKTYSREYSEAYHSLLDGMVERRLRASISAVGSFWYSAWIEAGQPDLGESLGTDELEQLETEHHDMDLKSRAGRIMGREHQE